LSINCARRGCSQAKTYLFISVKINFRLFILQAA
jgi:hypothetical protein